MAKHHAQRQALSKDLAGGSPGAPPTEMYLRGVSVLSDAWRPGGLENVLEGVPVPGRPEKCMGQAPV